MTTLTIVELVIGSVVIVGLVIMGGLWVIGRILREDRPECPKGYRAD